MTNFNPSRFGKKKFLSPERSVFLIPILSGMLLGLLTLIFFVTPQIINIKTKNKEINYLKEKLSYIPIYNNAIKKANLYKKDAYSQQERLLQLVAGSKELKTILSKINILALKNNIQIIEIMPGKKKKLQTSKSSDLLLKPGVIRHPYKLKISGGFNNLISFLRDIESLETIIATSNINVNEISPSYTPFNNPRNIKSTDNKIRKILLMSVNLDAYGRDK